MVRGTGETLRVSIPAFSCPAEAPWLLNHQWDKWRKVFPGIAVTEPGGIGVSMTAAEQFDGNGRATGWGTDWTNSAMIWGSVNTVTITADCTSDPNCAAVR